MPLIIAMGVDKAVANGALSPPEGAKILMALGGNMKIDPVHITCPNCNFAVENRMEKCPRCGAAITWPKAEKPKAEKK